MIKQIAGAALALCVVCGCSGSGGNESGANVTGVATSGAAGTGPPSAADQAPKAITTAPARAVALALTGGGLQAVDAHTGRTSTIPFGRPLAEVIAAVSRISGEQVTGDGVNEECGAGPTRIVQFGDGLSLLGQEDRFSGWEVDETGHTTIDGIGVGSTRAALAAALPRVEPSTLGVEWTVGEGEEALGGLLSDDSPKGRVTAIWAGLTCHFR